MRPSEMGLATLGKPEWLVDLRALRNTGAPLTDFLTKETRSRVMARIRSKDTKPELALRRALYAAGIRGWRCHPEAVPGQPGVSFERLNVAVFLTEGSGTVTPSDSRAGNLAATGMQEVAGAGAESPANERLLDAAWEVLRFWGFEVEQNLRGCVKACGRWVDGDPPPPARK
jgi:DNA mismatch endonuclease (patch repair protein)